MEKPGKSRSLTAVVSVILLISAVLLLLAAKKLPGFAEWYSVNVYSLITGTLGRLSGIVGFSVAEAAVVILPVLIIADVLRCRRRLKTALLHLLLIISLLFFMYAANCGVNYSRNSFVDRDALASAEFTEEQLTGLCEYIIAQIDASEEAAAADAAYPEGDLPEDTKYPEGSLLADAARSSMRKLSEEDARLRGFYPAPKQLSFLSRAFSKMGVSGIYSPFTVEANINGEMPGVEKPFTACHELSHLRGFMNEGEANYIGWLACIGSDDPAFRRSGWLIGWMHAGSALRGIDPEEYDRLLKSLPVSAVHEIEEDHSFWASHESKASEIQDQVNDAYLKANGQTEGIRSYGMLTTLMLMWYYERPAASPS